MAAKKTPVKSAVTRTRRAPRPAAKPHAPAPSFTPEPPAPASAAPKPFPGGTVAVAVILIAGLALWCWHRACPAPQEAPAATGGAAAAPAPAAPPVAAQAPAGNPPSEVGHLTHHGHRHILVLGRGGELSVRCWRDGKNPAELDIFSAHNRRVRAITSDNGPRGWLKLRWDGLDDAGSRVAEGTYFARPSVADDQILLEIKVKN